jgi:hypothetical protein
MGSEQDRRKSKKIRFQMIGNNAGQDNEFSHCEYS